MPNKKTIGTNGENAAISYLEAQGYQILSRNYQAGRYELDIIALEKDILCFIEVKNYQYNSLKPLYSAINSKKKYFLITAAKHFLATHRQYESLISRFDAIFASHTKSGTIIKIELVRDFFRP